MLPGFIIGILCWGLIFLISRKINLQFKQLVLIVLLFGTVIRIFFTIFTPTFYAPDEQPHFKYIQYLYENKKLPVQISKTNDPGQDWEYYQPPFYYLVLTPLYWLVDKLFYGDVKITVVALRLFSLLLSVIFIYFTLKILNNLNLNDFFIKTFVICMVFLLPSYVLISSVINNDNLVIVFSSVVFFFLTRNISLINSIYIGLVLGLAILTKLSAFILVLGVLLFFVYNFFRKKSSIGETVTHIAIISVISIIISLPLFIRNFNLYGDIIGESVANVRVIWPSLLYGFLATIKYMIDSFWASAGITYNIRFLSNFSLLITAYLIFTIIYNLFRNKSRLQNYLNNRVSDFLVPMITTLIVAIILVIRIGLLYGQGQGRFLYILLIPTSILSGISIEMVKNEKIRNLSIHLVGFFLLYNFGFLSYCIMQYQVIK